MLLDITCIKKIAFDMSEFSSKNKAYGIENQKIYIQNLADLVSTFYHLPKSAEDSISCNRVISMH